MLKILFDRYKWVAVAVAFLAYSVFVWDVAGDRVESKWVEKQAKIEVANAKLVKDITTSFDVAIAKQNKLNKDQTKELWDELAKDPRYKSCRTTDGVRNTLQRKLDSQPKLP